MKDEKESMNPLEGIGDRAKEAANDSIDKQKEKLEEQKEED